MTEIINKPTEEGYYWADIVYDDGEEKTIMVQAQNETYQGLVIYDTGGYQLTTNGKKSITFLDKIKR